MANINISNETVILSKSAEDIESILSGYSDLKNSVLTEVLNRETADNELSLRISNINGVEYIQVDELPSEPLKDHFDAFYIVANGRKEDNNLFTEYYWKEGKWETFGSASLDLSSYVKKSEIDTAPTANSTNPVTSDAIKRELDSKADKQTANGGFAAGRNSVAGLSGVSIGKGASCGNGVAIGMNAKAGFNGLAIGIDTECDDGVAIGNEAKANNSVAAIQIGKGTNQNEFSMQVYDYQLLVDDATTKSATDGSKYLKDVGKLSSLATSVKDNIVNAINSIVTLLYQKVDKVNGKGLSTNDYTDEDAAKLLALPTKSELNSASIVTGKQIGRAHV